MDTQLLSYIEQRYTQQLASVLISALENLTDIYEDYDELPLLNTIYSNDSPEDIQDRVYEILLDDIDDVLLNHGILCSDEMLIIHRCALLRLIVTLTMEEDVSTYLPALDEDDAESIVAALVNILDPTISADDIAFDLMDVSPVFITNVRVLIGDPTQTDITPGHHHRTMMAFTQRVGNTIGSDYLSSGAAVGLELKYYLMADDTLDQEEDPTTILNTLISFVILSVTDPKDISHRTKEALDTIYLNDILYPDLLAAFNATDLAYLEVLS